MVDTEYNTDNCKSSKTCIEAKMKYPEKLNFVPDYLKTKKMSKHALKKLLFVITYVPDRYKT